MLVQNEESLNYQHLILMVITLDAMLHFTKIPFLHTILEEVRKTGKSGDRSLSYSKHEMSSPDEVQYFNVLPA